MFYAHNYTAHLAALLRLVLHVRPFAHKKCVAYELHEFQNLYVHAIILGFSPHVQVQLPLTPHDLLQVRQLVYGKFRSCIKHLWEAFKGSMRCLRIISFFCCAITILN